MNSFLIENLQFTLRNKKILLGITGSIAAFKACDIVRFLKECGADVRVILSQGAENFVTTTTLETLSGNPVLKGFWGASKNAEAQGTHHIDTARWADLILVAPATANILAKMANGFADDLLTTEILAFQGPVLIAPAMNPAMYAHPAVQKNVDRLKEYQNQFIGPTAGKTSCGEEGIGRMVEPEQIVVAVAAAFYPKKLRKLLITLGPTLSRLDPVRYLTNRSSGLMGASLCWAALEKGFQVTAISGPTAVPLPQGIEVIPVETAEEMMASALAHWDSSDLFIGSAAVLDWQVTNYSPQKLKKTEGSPEIQFSKTPDILAELGRRKKAHQFILGFAAETEQPIENGLKKLQSKNCDAIFINDVSKPGQGFESSANAGWWISTQQDQAIEIPRSSKAEVARKIMEQILRLNKPTG